MKDPIQLKGYFPGAIGRITTLHAVYYHEHWGPDRSFEAQVGEELSLFISRFDRERDRLWCAVAGEQLAGSIAIAEDRVLTDRARLRWFIVDPRYQGHGPGKLLISKAVDFTREKGYNCLYLWTFRGLDMARSIYEKTGFRISEEREKEQWGRTVMEEWFELFLYPHGSEEE